jgi:AraC family transcriptional regulator
MEVEIKEIPKTRVAFMRHTGPYMECGKTWEKFGKWMQKNGMDPQNTVMYGLSYDNPETTPPEKLRYDCCAEVGDDVVADGDVQIEFIGGKDYGIAIHKGPYDKMSEAFKALFTEWLPTSGREPEYGPCIEIYRPGAMDMSKPETLCTELCVPLK